MGKENTQRGITLIALIVTIIVLLLLAGITVYIFSEEGPIEHAKMSKFATEFREVEERVQLYVLDKDIEEILPNQEEKQTRQSESEQQRIPVLNKVTVEEKEKIVKDIPSLKIKMEELSQKSIAEMNVYWIDKDKIQVNKTHQYLIDIETLQIYDYEGQKIYRKMWHTLDSGIGSGQVGNPEEGEDIWDGWIKLTLYYPAGSTDRQWRLGEEGETRYDSNLMWKDYVGPIMVKLSDVENVWIKYNLNGEEVIVPPMGRVLVDIQPDSYLPNMADKVKIKVVFDKEASKKEYRVGSGPWTEYTEEFYVTENTIVEARAQKKQNICDSEGNIISEVEAWGRDNIYVGNIGIQESELAAPNLVRKAKETEAEVAKVEAVYPEGAVRKVYKINYGEEREYTEPISVTRYGTHIIAYYYNAEGKRSKARQIIINETETPSEEYRPNTPGAPGGSGGSGESSGSNPTQPSYAIPAPIISANPTGITTSTKVSIQIPNGRIAKKTYLKIGNEGYKEYTNPIDVTSNTTIKAYYVTDKGEISSTAIKRIDNIKLPDMPYVKLQADPDPYSSKYGIEKVTVTISAEYATTLEYSYNGVEYMTYQQPLEITKNGRIYARGKNANGTTVQYLDITNIGSLAPTPKEKLNVTINVNPEPELTEQLIDKAVVTIEYDQRASKKYYKIGEQGELKEYTEPIQITSNGTIYAYATNDTGYGENKKQIDHLTTGIAEPEITASPSNKVSASKTKISIKFDRQATIKRYQIDGGEYKEYTGEIEVDRNCKITAYNSNKLGQAATSTYTVTNIVAETPTIVIDKGMYFIIKLNYPPNTTGREYKWQVEGEWKGYKEDGILLIKPEYKDEILSANGNIKIKIEDETGAIKDFNGDWYFVTGSIQELMENIAMRWDRISADAPNIILNTIEPTKEVTVSILYRNALVKREYKIINPDGTTEGWKEYKEPLTINRKNAIVYARGQDEAEVWSKTAMKKITNIDEEAPVIKVAADLEQIKQRVGLKIQVTDDVRVDTIKWAKGIQKPSYFVSEGNRIENDTIVYAEENGYYTIFAQDGVGNTQTYVLEITNIDKTAPKIQITVAPDNQIVTEVKINIEYGDSTLKQYKIGTSNTTWSQYNGEISLTSYTVLANKWKNEDNTVTIYAKGRDSAGNETIVSEKILSLDLDELQLPVIESNYGYPIVTEQGIQIDGATTIKYDTREDVDNYYSIDNGTTWNKYTGSFNMPGVGIITAKSVKKSSGLEIVASKTINKPSDALGPAAYDGDESTYEKNKFVYGKWDYMKLYVDPNMWGKKIYYKAYFDCYVGDRVEFGAYNENTNSSTIYIRYTSAADKMRSGEVIIPIGTTYIYAAGYDQANIRMYEIRPVREQE